jgi:leukotriene A-4 hydrolase/aminopeptidase
MRSCGKFVPWNTALLALLVVIALPLRASANRTTAHDRHSFANPEQIRVTRVELDLTADFDKKQLRGTATLTVQRQPGCPADAPLILDTRGLTIESVRATARPDEWKRAPFEHGQTDPILGTPLKVTLPAEATQVRIAYATAPTATAVQWLVPAATAGKRHPFLFTQSEAIHARSWIPLQDTPGVRVTYGARIRVPEGLRAVMSADQVATNEKGPVFAFDMPQPIPSYLIALAIGDLVSEPLGPRSGVVAEPSVVKAAAYEFADTEAMIKATESLYGPYRWGRYDLLVLPPSFPFGGMENPKLTFATPTVLAGDRSLVSLVAHELAHSWSGNLVTNATWSDFWLNEGFTNYIERRIVEVVYGPERAEMERTLGLAELRNELKELPPKDQILHIDLSGRDPDDGITRIAYEKGALFLTALEQAFGRPRFDAFLRAYFDHFAFQSLTTAEFEAYLREHLLETDKAAAARVDVHAWLYEPGLPKGHPEPTSARFVAVDRAVRDWLDGTRPADQLDTKKWTTHEWLRFLKTLPVELPAEKMAALDRAFALTASGNAEIAHQWLLMAIRNHYDPAGARLEAYLTSIGRRKLVVPLYAELAKSPSGKAKAEAIYAKARPSYHPLTIDTVDRLLKNAAPSRP